MDDRQTLGHIHKKPRFIKPDNPRPTSPKRKNCGVASENDKQHSARVVDEDDNNNVDDDNLVESEERGKFSQI